MKRTPFFIFQISLFCVDLAAIILSFGFAYYARLHYDARPFFFDGNTRGFLLALLAIIPLWAIILLVAGVYERKSVSVRSALYPRLLVVAVLSVLGLIAFDFFTKSEILDTRSIAIYAMLICFVALIFLREMAGLVYRLLLRHGIGCQKVVVYGDHENTRIFTEYVRENPNLGYRVVGVVAKKVYLAESVRQFRSLTTVLDTEDIDIVVQTAGDEVADVYARAINHHVGYMYVPDNETIAQNAGELRLLGTQPVVDIQATPLVNEGRLIKRATDLVLGALACVVSLPLILIIAALQKIIAPTAPIFYRQKRVTRFGRTFYIYKFRSMATEDEGKLSEEVNVPRFGRFLRATSLDEIPQFWNVLKGDISLVGPRALIPSEIKAYPKHSVILMVKSGLTGLAQVSGRKEISFEERRTLDIYYVQHWSIWLDLQIIVRTIKMVVLMRGAK
jgi:exopolysaccharide biosynthesis polyprenyl glycosylphosphotransferase